MSSYDCNVSAISSIIFPFQEPLFNHICKIPLLYNITFTESVDYNVNIFWGGAVTHPFSGSTCGILQNSGKQIKEDLYLYLYVYGFEDLILLRCKFILTIYRTNIVPIKIFANYFVDIDKLILKCIKTI